MFRWALLGGSMRTAQHHACRVPSDKITGRIHAISKSLFCHTKRNSVLGVLELCCRQARTSRKIKHPNRERACTQAGPARTGIPAGCPTRCLLQTLMHPPNRPQHQCRATLRSANCTHQFVWHVQKLQHPQHFLCVRRGCPSVQAHRLPHCCPHSCHRALSACAP